MVKVLNVGTKQVTCWNCKSQLEYSQAEVSLHKINRDYLGDYDTVYGIKCPVCSKVVKDK